MAAVILPIIIAMGTNLEFLELADPEAIGVKAIEGYASPTEIETVCAEAHNPELIEWDDTHDVYQNESRGLTIVQNHFTFAHKLSRGDQSALERIPATVNLYHRTQRFINAMSPIFPSLADWEADELSFHLYDDQDVGLSKHYDQSRFIGVIAIIAVDGECDLVVTGKDGDVTIPTNTGTLTLLRGPGLFEWDEKTQGKIRPEHSVRNLRTPTRLSMMLRANIRPDEQIRGFRFHNWQGKLAG